jgi:signal transduction histidine kinase
MTAPTAPAPAIRLLIVDDEAAHLRALCDTLGTLDYETAGCGSGEEAIALLRSQSFDLILSDLKMPGMDGISLLRQALELDPTMMGIIMTGEGSISTAVAAMQSGAFDYILKPFKLATALPVLARALKVRKLRADNAALEAQVHRQLKQLEAANSDLESFSYSVSHDLRGPLHVIEGFSNILASRHAQQLDEKGMHYLDRIRASVGQMNQLVEGLLRLSSVARQQLASQTVDMNALVHAVLDELHHEGLLPGSTTLNVAPLPAAWGDAVLLRQALKNLLSNAAKFSARSERAEVSIGSMKREGEEVYFIRDNGAGFDMSYAQRLFEPFQRFHRPEEYAGTGVGLSIVQRVIARHGGRIWVETAAGEGACFYFSLDAEPGPGGEGLQNSRPAPKLPA